MKFFSFFKPKKDPWKKIFQKMDEAAFPNGSKDIDAGANELLHILDNKIDYELARNIFKKSVGISMLAENFDKERLVGHLSGYCIKYFSSEQIDSFYKYLLALAAAMKFSRKSPSEVKRDGENYSW